ncbi:ABC transporter ATP-binding protein [Paenibacillus ehimensis]|uniref:ABC transporter ATP-binding protein n=1 Tax=Paenibacillus ehimensis TaxID=79264 RepID=UPI00047151E4|nr:ABC transporter ATP-binding protein [Paenibacillus ehimensis]
MIIRTNRLGKRYGPRAEWAVQEVGLSVRAGEIYGFLGQNGAGKTTTLRMIMGLIAPTEGNVELFGRPAGRGRDFYARIGYVPDVPGFYPQLTVEEHLRMHGKLIGYAGKDRTEETIRRLSLWEMRATKAGRLSHGARQRLSLAKALVHTPELLILDEPTNGVDPAGIEQLRQLLLDLAKQHGVTILLSSHLLGEVQQIADRVGILHRGRLLAESGLAALEQQLKSCIDLRVSDVRKAVVLLEQRLELNDYEVREPDGLIVHVPADKAAGIARTLIGHGIDLHEMNVRQGTLEDYYLRLIGGEAQ